MNPSDRVERCNFSNLFWQLISTWPLLEKEFKKGNLFAEWRLWVFSRCGYFLDVSFTLFMVPGSRQWQEWSWCLQQGRPRSQSRAGRPPHPCLRSWWLRYWWVHINRGFCQKVRKINLHWEATCWCKCPSRWWEEQEPGVEIPGSGRGWRHWGRKVVEWCLHVFFVKYHNINEKVQQIFWLSTLDKGCHEDQRKRRVPWSRAASWSDLRVLLRSCLGRPGTRPSWARSRGCKVVPWESWKKTENQF